MRHGVLILPEHSWPRARDRWMLAERLGFAHAWTYDHLMWRWFAERPWFSAVPGLAAAAAVTDRIGLGTLVASPHFRHPVSFAKELVSLDDIAPGRMVCGVGAGAPGFDESLQGGPVLSPRERADRFGEFVSLLHRLLHERRTTYTGQWFSAHDAVVLPKPRAMPLAVAAAGPRGMALAARYADIWVTSGPPNVFEQDRFDRVAPLLEKQMAALDEACAAQGRDPAGLRRLLLTDGAVGGVLESTGSYEDASGLFADLGFTDLVVHWPRPGPPFEGDEQVLLDFASAHLKGVR